MWSLLGRLPFLSEQSDTLSFYNIIISYFSLSVNTFNQRFFFEKKQHGPNENKSRNH